MPHSTKRSGASSKLQQRKVLPQRSSTDGEQLMKQIIMQLGMIGLGRMGGNMVRRLMKNGHKCVVFDRTPDTVRQFAGEGATGAEAMEDFVKKLSKPRAAWVMVPAGAATETTVMKLAELMEAGDTIIDGGNSYFKDDIPRAATLREQGLHYLDVGTSGGVWGIERGYCMMIGGS